jgi:selT/selW/selH-like putative selenoprotein
MHVTIEFCVVCHYEPRAAGLAAEIRQRHPDATIELIKSSGGRFEVVVDGQPVFEKSKLGRHAQPGEVLGLIDRQGT